MTDISNIWSDCQKSSFLIVFVYAELISLCGIVDVEFHSWKIIKIYVLFYHDVLYKIPESLFYLINNCRICFPPSSTTCWGRANLIIRTQHIESFFPPIFRSVELLVISANWHENLANSCLRIECILTE